MVEGVRCHWLAIKIPSECLRSGMGASDPTDAIHAALRTALGDEAARVVESIKPIPSAGPRQRYEVRRAESIPLMIVLGPSAQAKLLRREGDMTGSEAAVISWLNEQGLADSAAEIKSNIDDVVRLGPSLKHYCSSRSTGLRASFNIFEAMPGAPVWSLERPLSAAQRKYIDRQLGKMLAQMSRLTSTGQFGPVGYVSLLNGREAHGARTWAAAYRMMLEDVLEEAENAAIVLPYQWMRDALNVQGRALDGIKEAKLFLLDGPEDWSIFVEPVGQGDEEGLLKVVGIQDWSAACFGDPQMAQALAFGNSAELQEAFHATAGGTRSAGDRCPNNNPHEASECIRMLLYQMYHDAVAIVRQYHRLRLPGDKEELAARKRLQDVLDKLDAVSSRRDEPNALRCG
jgi:hypothetical protein